MTDRSVAGLGSRALRGAIPVLSTRNVTLRAAGEADYGFLRALAVDPLTSHRWRLRGSILSAPETDSMIWAGVEAQFVIFSPSDPKNPLGVTQIYGVSHRNRYAYFALALAPPARRRGWPFDAALLTVGYAFFTWDLRKIYAEVPQINYEEIASGEGLFFKHEALLEEHEFVAGQYQDTHVISIDAKTWPELDRRYLQGTLDV